MNINPSLFQKTADFENSGTMQVTGPESFQRGEIPNVAGKQSKWQYAVIDDDNGKRIQFNTGDRVLEWGYESKDEPDTHNEKALPVNFVRRHDVDQDAFGKGATAKGVMQVHKSGPEEVYATLQDGSRNLTFKFMHNDGGRWTMIPKAQKVKPALQAPEFARNVQTSAEAASTGTTPYIEQKVQQAAVNAPVSAVNPEGEPAPIKTAGFGMDVVNKGIKNVTGAFTTLGDAARMAGKSVGESASQGMQNEKAKLTNFGKWMTTPMIKPLWEQKKPEHVEGFAPKTAAVTGKGLTWLQNLYRAAENSRLANYGTALGGGVMGGGSGYFGASDEDRKNFAKMMKRISVGTVGGIMGGAILSPRHFGHTYIRPVLRNEPVPHFLLGLGKDVGTKAGITFLSYLPFAVPSIAKVPENLEDATKYMATLSGSAAKEGDASNKESALGKFIAKIDGLAENANQAVEQFQNVGSNLDKAVKVLGGDPEKNEIGAIPKLVNSLDTTGANVGTGLKNLGEGVKSISDTSNRVANIPMQIKESVGGEMQRLGIDTPNERLALGAGVGAAGLGGLGLLATMRARANASYEDEEKDSPKDETAPKQSRKDKKQKKANEGLDMNKYAELYKRGFDYSSLIVPVGATAVGAGAGALIGKKKKRPGMGAAIGGGVGLAGGLALQHYLNGAGVQSPAIESFNELQDIRKQLAPGPNDPGFAQINSFNDISNDGWNPITDVNDPAFATLGRNEGPGATLLGEIGRESQFRPPTINEVLRIQAKQIGGTKGNQFASQWGLKGPNGWMDSQLYPLSDLSKSDMVKVLSERDAVRTGEAQAKNTQARNQKQRNQFQAKEKIKETYGAKRNVNE